MTARSKSAIAAFFQTGDRPTQTEFSDLIDSYQDASDVLLALSSAAHNGGIGFVQIEGSASVTVRSAGAFGVLFVGAATTAAALGQLGLTAGAVGIQLLSAITTASAQNQLVLGTASPVQHARLGLGGAADATKILQITQAADAIAVDIVNSDDDKQSIFTHNSHASFAAAAITSNVTRAANAGYEFFSGFSGNLGDKEVSLQGDGVIKSDQAATTPADYAEFFENKTAGAIPFGVSVTMVGGHVSAATGNSAKPIIGVVRPPGASAIVANSHWSRSHKARKMDKWGRKVINDVGEFVATSDYDKKRPYVPRAERPNEWSIIGLLGQIPVLKTAPKAAQWVKMWDIDADTEMWLVR